MTGVEDTLAPSQNGTAQQGPPSRSSIPMQSTPPGEPSPFDDGELYDIICQGLDYDIDFYAGLARAAKGPVLDIACGTGRVLLPLLQAGIEVDGVDLFQP